MEDQKDMGPLLVGSSHQVTIDAMAYGGSGIAKINHLVVFVPYTAPGDVAEIELIEVKPNFAKAKMLRMTAFSPMRCEPVCRFFGSCGGCQYQHITYEHQLKTKETQVKDLFQRIGNVRDPQVSGIVPSSPEYGYRIKAEFHGKSSAIGYFADDNRTLLDVPACPLVDEKVNHQLTLIREMFQQQHPAQVPEPLVVWSHIYEQKTLNYFDTRTLPRFVSRKVKDRIFNVPYFGFFQVNPGTSEKVVDAVIDLCQLTGDETIIDAYCGCGLFTLFLAEKAKNVFGIELDKESAYSAVVNAKNYQSKNIRILKGKVEDKMAEIVPQMENQSTIILLDPPRTGCSREALEAITAFRPKKIIYISCDPATQARDAKFFIEHNYQLKDIRPFDMFPQTRHIEVVCVFDSASN
jgi:23S rRNA (uracil1939-C5)-methyltransferase